MFAAADNPSQACLPRGSFGAAHGAPRCTCPGDPAASPGPVRLLPLTGRGGAQALVFSSCLVQLHFDRRFFFQVEYENVRVVRRRLLPGLQYLVADLGNKPEFLPQPEVHFASELEQKDYCITLHPGGFLLTARDLQRGGIRRSLLLVNTRVGALQLCEPADVNEGPRGVMGLAAGRRAKTVANLPDAVAAFLAQADTPSKTAAGGVPASSAPAVSPGITLPASSITAGLVESLLTSRTAVQRQEGVEYLGRKLAAIQAVPQGQVCWAAEWCGKGVLEALVPAALHLDQAGWEGAGRTPQQMRDTTVQCLLSLLAGSPAEVSAVDRFLRAIREELAPGGRGTSSPLLFRMVAEALQLQPVADQLARDEGLVASLMTAARAGTQAPAGGSAGLGIPGSPLRKKGEDFTALGEASLQPEQQQQQGASPPGLMLSPDKGRKYREPSEAEPAVSSWVDTHLRSSRRDDLPKTPEKAPPTARTTSSAAASTSGNPLESQGSGSPGLSRQPPRADRATRRALMGLKAKSGQDFSVDSYFDSLDLPLETPRPAVVSGAGSPEHKYMPLLFMSGRVFSLNRGSSSTENPWPRGGAFSVMHFEGPHPC